MRLPIVLLSIVLLATGCVSPSISHPPPQTISQASSGSDSPTGPTAALNVSTTSNATTPSHVPSTTTPTPQGQNETSGSLDVSTTTDGSNSTTDPATTNSTDASGSNSTNGNSTTNSTQATNSTTMTNSTANSTSSDANFTMLWLTVAAQPSTPCQYDTETIWVLVTDSNGHGVPNATVRTEWHLIGLIDYLSGVTNASGVARVSRDIGNQPEGKDVEVDVTLEKADSYAFPVKTHFTPMSCKG